MPKSEKPSAAWLRIQLLVCDVDGVLTDGRIGIDAAGEETKFFSAYDGAGFALARAAGLRTAWLSARRSPCVARRARECRIDYLHQGQQRKAQGLLALCRRFGLPPRQVAYMGDDLLDLPALKQAGLKIAVANAVPEVKRAADYITRCAGGTGAAREVIERILRAQGRWIEAWQRYLGPDAKAI